MFKLLFRSLLVPMKLMILPIMGVIEITLMVTCLLMGVMKIKPNWALKIIEWSKELPDLKWYFRL